MVEPLVIPFVVVVRDELAHGRPEERVAVMDEDPDVSQESEVDPILWTGLRHS